MSAVEQQLVVLGWEITKTPYIPDLSGAFGDNQEHADWRNNSVVPAYRAVKFVAGNQVVQAGDTLEQLLVRCESWDASQASLKPEFRLGAGDIRRVEGVAT